MSDPYLVQRQQLAIKAEAVEGTAETLAAADLIAPIFEPEWAPTFEVDEREVVQPSLSRTTRVVGERSAVIRFATEVKGSGTAGTAPPNLSAALQACGFDETIVVSTSVTYAPASEDVPSVTIQLRELSTNGTAKIKEIHGARGTVVFEVVKGQIVRARFEFTGVYNKPTEGVVLTPQPSLAPLPVAALALSFSFQGVGTLKAQTITVDKANTVALRNDVNQASGNFSAVITARTPVGAIDPEREDIATIDTFANLVANTEGVLSYVLGTVAGNILTFNAPKAQIMNDVDADRDGIRTDALDLAFNQSAVAGDDEFTLAFT